MSSKMLERIKKTERRKEKLAKAAKRKTIANKIAFNMARIKYNKIWIFNYFLLLLVLLLVSFLCWKAKSLLMFFSSIVLLYLIFIVHHYERITRDEEPSLGDYETATMVMTICSYAAIAITGLDTVIFCFLS